MPRLDRHPGHREEDEERRDVTDYMGDWRNPLIMPNRLPARNVSWKFATGLAANTGSCHTKTRPPAGQRACGLQQQRLHDLCQAAIGRRTLSMFPARNQLDDVFRGHGTFGGEVEASSNSRRHQLSAMASSILL